MTTILLGIHSFLSHRKLFFYALTLMIFVMLAWLASSIHVEEDITRALPNSRQTEEINTLLRQSKFADKIIVKVKGNEAHLPEDLIAVADSLGDVLMNDSSLSIKEIKSRIDDESAFEIYDAVQRNLPYYLDENDYHIIDSLILPESIQSKVESNYNTLTSAQGFILKRLIADDPLGISSLALKKLEKLQIDGSYELYNGSMVSKNRQSVFLFITPRNTANETSKNEKLIDALDAFITLRGNANNIEVLYFGGPAVGVSNARQLKRDTILTLSITVLSLLAFILFFFRSKRVPIVMMLPVVFGALFAIAIIAVWKGTISSIAIGAGSIVLGIAINYSIHFFSHLKHCGSVKQTISDLLQPMTIGSFTTVGSFFALTLLQSHILNDFGLFAGLSLTGATIFTLVFLPQFVSERNGKHEVYEPNWLERLLSNQMPHQGVVFLIVILLTVFFWGQASKVGFDSDMNHFSFMTEPLTKAQQELDVMQDDSTKTVYIATTATTKEEMLRKNESLLQRIDKGKEKGYVTKYSSINLFLPSKQMQQEKRNVWTKFWSNEKRNLVLANLRSEGAKFKFRKEAFNHFEEQITNVIPELTEEDVLLFQSSVGSELMFTDSDKQVILNAVKVNKAARSQFYPEIQNQGAVILDKQIITNAFVEIIYSDFNHILLYTALLVFISLLISYASLELTIITFLPMFISCIWILGIMGLFGLKFNLINIIISTFIFGLGDDFSIFTTDGLMSKYATGKETFSSHRVSIFLCAIATIIGLGALIFAKHPALQSIALISIIGIFCVLFIGQTVQPFLFRILIQNRKERGLPPYTIPSLFLTILAFTYYVVGSLLLTMIGYVIIYAFPFINLKTRKLWLHHLMCWCLRGLTYMMMNVRKTHEGLENMDFSKPAIIIANHQSFLDILVTVMQHPKLILLTNKWVYYSPVFGKVVQLADYYPVMEGVDPAIDKFEDIVKDGYSIVIFPEGTRSADRSIKRFHKGAFFLAEKLNLDIVPMVLHGTGDTIRKGDYMVMNASMTMKFLPRISPTDNTFGEGYAQRTKSIATYFKSEYQKLKERKETPFYFRQQLRLNYTYKGPAVYLHALQYSFSSEQFVELDKVIGRKTNVAVLGCSYGYVAYMLMLLSSRRAVVGFDIDQTKIDVANNGYLKSPNLSFHCVDVLRTTFDKQDVFVINAKLFQAIKTQEKQEFISLLKGSLEEGGCIIIWSKKGIQEVFSK